MSAQVSAVVSINWWHIVGMLCTKLWSYSVQQMRSSCIAVFRANFRWNAYIRTSRGIGGNEHCCILWNSKFWITFVIISVSWMNNCSIYLRLPPVWITCNCWPEQPFGWRAKCNGLSGLTLLCEGKLSVTQIINHFFSKMPLQRKWSQSKSCQTSRQLCQTKTTRQK